MIDPTFLAQLYGASVLVSLRDEFSSRRLTRTLSALGVGVSSVKTLDDAWHELRLWGFAYNALIIEYGTDPDASCLSAENFVRMVREYGYPNLIILLSSHGTVELPYGMPVENCAILRKVGSDDELVSILAQTTASY